MREAKSIYIHIPFLKNKMWILLQKKYGVILLFLVNNFLTKMDTIRI